MNKPDPRKHPAFVIGHDGALHPVPTRQAWARRRADIRRRVEQVAGALPAPSHSPPPDFEVLDEAVLEGGLRRRKIAFAPAAPDAPRVPAWLFLPSGADGRGHAPASAPARAAVLCLHQTTHLFGSNAAGSGKDEPAGLGGDPELHYALELAQRGFVTLAPDAPNFGEHPCVTSYPNAYASATIKVVSDNLRAIDILTGLRGVDAGRIGVIGHSLGGFNALLTALFDLRLRVIVSSCGHVDWQTYARTAPAGDLSAWSNPSAYMPRIATAYGNDPDRIPFDLHEVVAALAPRPAFFNAPLHDTPFEVHGVRQTLAAARPVYALFDAGHLLHVEHPDSGHGFQEHVRERAYDFLKNHLLESDPAGARVAHNGRALGMDKE